MKVYSNDFNHNEVIPARFTCEGTDLSPHLAWSNLPEGTKSLALIVDDPDAPDPAQPERTWVHWVLYNISPTLMELPANAQSFSNGVREGKNDWGKIGYGGPCPPTGRHRYFFKLYALDSTLPELEEETKDDLLKAMEGHVLEKAELVGTYQKTGAEARLAME